MQMVERGMRIAPNATEALLYEYLRCEPNRGKGRSLSVSFLPRFDCHNFSTQYSEDPSGVHMQFLCNTGIFEGIKTHSHKQIALSGDRWRTFMWLGLWS